MNASINTRNILEIVIIFINMSDSTPYAIPIPLKTLSKPAIKPQPLKNAPNPTSKPAQPQQTTTYHKFVISPSNVQIFSTNPLVKKTIKSFGATHKFIIQNTKPALSKITIIRTFVKQAEPHGIIPLDITAPFGQCIEFYCQNCQDALQKLCEKDNLMLACIVNDKLVKVPMTLIVGCQPPNEINLRDRILELVKHRVTIFPVTTVDLKHCESLVGTCKKIFFDITTPATLNYVINSFRSLQPKVLILSHNNIRTLTRRRRPIQFETIDLSYNQIKCFEDLGSILLMNLKELDLRGNPVCEKSDYLERVKTQFPNIEIIDSNPITTTTKEVEKVEKLEEIYFPTSGAAEYLIDQFMEHYFNLYENPKKRRYLQEIYHREAVFTLTSDIVDEEGLSPASQRYKHHAHNLLQTKSPTDFSVGPAEIIRKICYLPQIEHDPRTFSVDILHYAENKSAMFIIHGLCREVPPKRTVTSVVYTFTRSFMLLAAEAGEFQIINDMFYVSNRKVESIPPIKPFKESFRYRELVEISKTIPVAISQEEKDGFLTIFIELTSLHVAEASEFLEKSKWNMREALETFIHESRFEEVDRQCFIHNEIKEVLFSEFLTIYPGMNTQKLGRILEKLKTLKDEGFLVKPVGISKPEWRKHLMTLKQILIKET